MGKEHRDTRPGICHVPGFLLEGFRLLEGKGKGNPPIGPLKGTESPTGNCCDMVLLYISITKTHIKPAR